MAVGPMASRPLQPSLPDQYLRHCASAWRHGSINILDPPACPSPRSSVTVKAVQYCMLGACPCIAGWCEHRANRWGLVCPSTVLLACSAFRSHAQRVAVFSTVRFPAAVTWMRSVPYKRGLAVQWDLVIGCKMWLFIGVAKRWLSDQSIPTHQLPIVLN